MHEQALHGEFKLRIDARRRLALPNDVRVQLAAAGSDAFITVAGRNQKVWLYPERYFERAVASGEGEGATGFPLAMFGLAIATRLQIDRRGGVTLPDKLLNHFAIFDEVSLIGVRDHFELWERTEWANHRATLLDGLTAAQCCKPEQTT